MRSFDSRKAIHGRVQARQHVARQGTTLSLYYVTDGAVTATPPGNPALPTGLIFDTAIRTYEPLPTARVFSTSSSTATAKTADPVTSTISITSTSTAASSDSTAVALDPAQRVYDGIANMALHSLPPAVIGIASGGSALVVLLALYCFICRWYYRRLPRSTKRWDVDDRAKKEVLYDDKPRYSPEDEAPRAQADDDRREVPVGDSYFPQGETWQKFEGRTAQHPESFIYTGPGLPSGMGPNSPGSPSSGTMSNSSSGLARPRPQFAHGGRRGQIESVFSNVSFPTTHRAESMRHSFYPEGYEHDGEVWDLASPGFANEGARPSFDSSLRSVNRASIFGEASARARGSVVIYESHPSGPLRSPSIVDDPFAGPGERSSVYTSSSGTERFAGKKSFEAHHGRNKSRDVRALDTLTEDVDELSSQGHGTVSSKSKYSSRMA